MFLWGGVGFKKPLAYLGKKMIFENKIGRKEFRKKTPRLYRPPMDRRSECFTWFGWDGVLLRNSSRLRYSADSGMMSKSELFPP